MATYTVEMEIEGTRYSVGADEVTIGSISQALDKSFGVSKVSNVRVVLENNDGVYSDSDVSSIFYNKDYIWSWIRIRAGWGPNLTTDLATQFQGKIYEVSTKEDYTAHIMCYDPLKDLMDYALPGSIVFSGALPDLDGMSPMELIKYLIEEVYIKDAVKGLKWYDFDGDTETDIIDAASYNATLIETGDVTVETSSFDEGTNLLDLIQDLLKLIGGYMYSSREGKVAFYVPGIAMWAGINSYTGDVSDNSPQVLQSTFKKVISTVYNSIVWKVGPSPTTYGPYQDEDSIVIYSQKTLEITSGWVIAEAQAEALSDRLLARYASPIFTFDGTLSYIDDGNALEEDLGTIIRITDPAHSVVSKDFELHQISRNLPQEQIKVVGQDAGALSGKFFIFSSDNDEGDGLGVTSTNFSVNWKLRFLFFGNAYSTDPHQDGSNPGFDIDGNNNGGIDPALDPDQWGNGLEEIFIFW